jgi:hypothetical protein
MNTKVQPILPVLLLLLFGAVVRINYIAGGLGGNHDTFVPSYNISFYLADSFWTTLIGMFVMVLLFVPYSVRMVRTLRRRKPGDKCSTWFFVIMSAVVVVGFLLVGVFNCDMSFRNGKLQWDANGAWRLIFHGLGACFAFFGLAVFGFGQALTMRSLIRNALAHQGSGEADRKSSLLFALGILCSCLVFVCVFLNQVVWNVGKVHDLHPKKPGPHSGTYLTDHYQYRATGLLAKSSYAEYGIIIFALLGMFFNGLQLHHFETNIDPDPLLDADTESESDVEQDDEKHASLSRAEIGDRFNRIFDLLASV